MAEPFYFYAAYVEDFHFTAFLRYSIAALLSFSPNIELPATNMFAPASYAGLIVALLMLMIFRNLGKSYSKNGGIASGVGRFFEPLVLYIRDEIAIPNIGEKHYKKYMSHLLTVFFFIWFLNMFGLTPLGVNVTGNIAITASLAIITYLITTFTANGNYWGHIFWPPGVPAFVKVILVPIEIMSVFIKPTVLMIRLTVNITAGHIIILSFVGLALMFGQDSVAAGYGVGVGSVLFMIFMYCLELLVAFLQAYVFTLLAALYFGEANQEHHHEHEHAEPHAH